MKKFILLSSVLVVCIITTLIIGEVIIRTQIPNPYKTKNEQVVLHADEIETLVLGSSHTFFGFRPEFYPNSFNLANTSQNFLYDRFMIEKYGSSCKNLRTVILPISYFSLFTKGFEDGDDSSWTYAINYKVYMDCPFHSDFSKYNFEIANPTVYFGKLQSLFTGGKNKCDNLGWGTAYLLSEKPRHWNTMEAVEAAGRHTAKDWSYIGRNVDELEKIVHYCQSRSISLVLIATPVWPAYYERLDAKQLGKMYAVINELKKKYGLRYYDYSKDKRFGADDFYDSDHLSDVGAKKFTLILRDELFGNIAPSSLGVVRQCE